MQAVLFDLDGTLLEVDSDKFMAEYVKDISRAVAAVADPGRFVKALMSSIAVMLANRGGDRTNAEAFWDDFRPRMEDCVEAIIPVIEDFYATKFDGLSRAARPCAGARKAVESAVGRGLRIALATNSVFPLTAVRSRMAWAGVEDLPWEFVSCYEGMHYCKPHSGFYREIAMKLGLPPENCLMVGNDAEEDLAASLVGMKTYLVTDFVKRSEQEKFRPDASGSLADLAGWLASARL